MNSKRQRRAVTLVSLLAVTALLGWMWLGKSRSTGGRRVVFYQDSMHPWVKLDQPGKCTICAMDLTPIYEGEKEFAADGGVVALSSNQINVLHVQTEEVKRQPLIHVLQVAGTIEANEGRKTYLASPAPGRVQSLAVPFAGMEVEKGQSLITLYSPELVQRRAYLFALRNDPSTAGNGLLHATKSADPYTGELLAPQSGVVTERAVYDGQYIEEGQRLLTIVDASTVWFRFDAYERDLPWIQPGQTIQVSVSAVPGHVFPAVVSFVDPMLNEATRTIKVRADISNPIVSTNGHPQRLLRFGMYAQGRLKAALPNIIAVPRSAVLYPGSAAYAYLDNGDGSYERRRVKVGRQGGDRWEVLSGLDEGERVVTAGNVLIDAQAQFNQSGDTAAAEFDSTTDSDDGSLKGMPAVAAMSSADPAASPAPDATRSTLSPSARDALREFLKVADGISQALAADDLKQLKTALGQLPKVSGTLPQQLGTQHPWSALAERIAAASNWPAPGDLAGARKSFLPFSTNVVALVQQVRTQEDEFGSLKVFYCPMAPKPGLWFQAKGPLRNPYYGSEMLTCGSEVKKPASAPKPATSLAHTVPEAHPPASASPAAAASTASRPPANLTAAASPTKANVPMPRSAAPAAGVSTNAAKAAKTGHLPGAMASAHGTLATRAEAIRSARENHETARARGEASYGFMAMRDELARQRWESIAAAGKSGPRSAHAAIPSTTIIRAGNSDEVMGVPQLRDQLVVYSGLAVTPAMERIRQPFFARLRGLEVTDEPSPPDDDVASVELPMPPEDRLMPPEPAQPAHANPPDTKAVCQMPAEEVVVQTAKPSAPAAAAPTVVPQVAAHAPAVAKTEAEIQTPLRAFLIESTGVSRALAADDLKQFNQQVEKLAAGLAAVQKELAGTSAGKTLLKRAESLAAKKSARDLAEARARFLPFSTALVEFTKSLGRKNPTASGLKIFHCPMAPKPGLWVQNGGSLLNPFYGAEMLTCGEEVTP